MQQFDTFSAWQLYRETLSGSIGLVATMGALHAGHLSLVEASIGDNDHTIVSIFVNPTQFDQTADLQQYPHTLSQDLASLKTAGVSAVLLPTYSLIYPDDYSYQVQENKLSQLYCGAHRKGHFDGVLTVVIKLLQIIKPQRAYFGEKDYQQLSLIKGMVSAFFLDVNIVACPIKREADGLAMSSRNLRLTSAQRKVAPLLYQTLTEESSLEAKQQRLNALGLEVDYVAVLNDRLLAAVKLGDIRLIDNVPYPQGVSL